MSSWLVEIKQETERAKKAQEIGNAGRLRTSARRIAGIAVQELQARHPHQFFGEDYIRALRAMAASASLPKEVVDAASRLQGKLSEDFSSPSIDPLGDAMIIVGFVQSELKKV
jgi:hypothetical protein